MSYENKEFFIRIDYGFYFHCVNLWKWAIGQGMMSDESENKCELKLLTSFLTW